MLLRDLLRKHLLKTNSGYARVEVNVAVGS